ncbi:diacylglycerol O-acyltransferase [Marmoricola endophyticus]|uniref:Diacylglycerol O-acyltransferase n=1 Tax=Marmoricola endophyticus TaxID=2040280 RepID=A0A917BUD1_9ACTN|nr:wax ester/triacylglycerol synthase family O-acyltransferase [Marmoricola endophyticus]GGF56654.1 diacylglycerol O-acyltransferase [Marmoricola endophyticus]
MAQQLSSDDLTILARETARTPLHNATLEIFQPGPDGFGYDEVLAHIEDRIAFVPRYRQRVRSSPGRLTNPVWLDDTDFDLTYHVRRSALPRPGSMDQLRDLVARVVSRRLDRTRPLWETYVVEGLEGGRVALFSKSHQVLVDGVRTVDIGQVLLDVDPGPRQLVREDWTPRPAPTGPGLLVDGVRELVLDPARAVDTVRSTVGSVRRGAQVLGERAGVAVGVHRRRPGGDLPFTLDPSEQRRVALVRTSLRDYRRVRRVHGGTVNDVILATVAGAVRAWLMTRAEAVGAGRRLRALVPMSVIDEESEPTSLGSSVIGHLIDLPIGEASPVVRLHQVSYALRAHSETGRAVAADRIAGVAGFAPTTFHALGTRVALEDDHDVHLVLTNVPGPQFPMFAARAEMTQSYPVPPLLPGFGLSIGVTSYDGSVSYGLVADREALPDVEVLAQCVRESLDELVDTASDDRSRAPRGRA